MCARPLTTLQTCAEAFVLATNSDDRTVEIERAMGLLCMNNFRTKETAGTAIGALLRILARNYDEASLRELRARSIILHHLRCLVAEETDASCLQYIISRVDDVDPAVAAPALITLRHLTTHVPTVKDHVGEDRATMEACLRSLDLHFPSVGANVAIELLLNMDDRWCVGAYIASNPPLVAKLLRAGAGKPHDEGTVWVWHLLQCAARCAVPGTITTTWLDQGAATIALRSRLCSYSTMSELVRHIDFAKEGAGIHIHGKALAELLRLTKCASAALSLLRYVSRPGSSGEFKNAVGLEWVEPCLLNAHSTASMEASRCLLRLLQQQQQQQQ